MGLSSAQARLLTITARKSDCEFQSMSLSHQKLALSRDMESITNEYQNALNATKLVYDFYGTGGSQMALNYSLLMSPSVYNDYSPKFVTDATNRIILNSQLANVARACGIPMEGYGGTNSDQMRAAFIQALAQEGILSASEVQSIENVQYNNAAGMGNGVIADQAIEYLTYEDLFEQLKTSSTNDLKDYGLYLGDFYTLYSNGKDDWTLLSARDKADDDNSFSWDKGYSEFQYNGAHPYSAHGANNRTGVYVKAEGGNYEYADGQTRRDDNTAYFSQPEPASIKFTDLLEGKNQYTFAIDSLDYMITDTAYMQRLMCGDDNGDGSKSVLNWMTDQLLGVLGETELNIQAIEYARSCITDMIWPDSSIQDFASQINTYSKDASTRLLFGLFKRNDGISRSEGEYLKSAFGKDCLLAEQGSFDATYKNAENCLGLCSYGEGVSVNLNNLAQVFMTAFVDYIKGMENTNYAYGPMKKNLSTLYNHETDTDVVFEQNVGYTTDIGADTTLATFYDTMFNIICTHGWTENGRIDDADYMQQMMKNGMVYLSTMGYDGTYGQSNYTTDKYVLEVADEEAITRAESKYKAAKARIEHKENTLDLKMKSLDTEISSLNQEYETAKTLIKNAVDKSFTRYQA